MCVRMARVKLLKYELYAHGDRLCKILDLIMKLSKISPHPHARRAECSEC